MALRPLAPLGPGAVPFGRFGVQNSKPHMTRSIRPWVHSHWSRPCSGPAHSACSCCTTRTLDFLACGDWLTFQSERTESDAVCLSFRGALRGAPFAPLLCALFWPFGGQKHDKPADRSFAREHAPASSLRARHACSAALEVGHRFSSIPWPHLWAR